MRIPQTGGSGAFTYAGPNKPQDAEEGETWYDTGDDRAVVFVDNSGTTEPLSLREHSELGGVNVGQHRSDQNILNVLDGATLASLALSDSLTLGGSAVATEPYVGSQVGTVSDALDSHESDTTNPHNVSDDQTGAATALNNHAGDADAHHSKPAETGSPTVNQTGGQVDLGSISGTTGVVYNDVVVVSSMSASLSTGGYGDDFDSTIEIEYYDFEQQQLSVDQWQIQSSTQSGASSNHSASNSWDKFVEVRRVEVTDIMSHTDMSISADTPAVVPHVHKIK